METFVIGLSLAHDISHLSNIPTSIVVGSRYGDVRVIINKAPTIGIIGDELNTNFDVLIDFTMENGYSTPVVGSDLLPDHRYQPLIRRGKHFMGLRMKMVMDEIEDHSFEFIDSYWLPTTGETVGAYGTHRGSESDKVILKPRLGARGGGQVLVDPKENDLHRAISRSSSIEKEDVTPGVQLIGNEDDETNQLDSNPVIQIPVKEVVDEWRVIWSLFDDASPSGGPVGVFKRTRYVTESGLERAAVKTGGWRHSGYMTDISSDPKIVEQMKYMMSRICEKDGFMCSFDIYTTPTGWGCFEYSCEMGYADMGNIAMGNVQQQFLSELYNNYRDATK